jgi:thiamine pyrophosphokinase
MTTFAVLLGGTLIPGNRLSQAVAGARFIAADGGMRHAATLGVTPELWVGDFDSTPPDLMARYATVPREAYPASKALTDGEIAVEAAVARGATRLVLAGALGGERSDHGLAHLLHAVRLAEAGFDVMLTSGDEEAYPLPKQRLTLDLPRGSLFSVLGFEALTGLCISNARYPLDDFSLAFGSSRTISNVAEGPVTVSLTSGRAIALCRPQDFSGA